MTTRTVLSNQAVTASHHARGFPRAACVVVVFLCVLLACCLVPAKAALADEATAAGGSAAAAVSSPDTAATSASASSSADVTAADATSTTASAPEADAFVPDASYGVFADHIKLQLFQSQQLLGLPVNSASYYFIIPAGVTFGSCTISFDVSWSFTLIDERSSISVDVNGNRIDTVPITSIGEDGAGRWNVEVPAEYLNAGAMNSLSFVTAHRSIEGDCADIDNPSNWVALEASSFLVLGDVTYDPLMLSMVYPSFFDSVLAGSGVSASFVFPESQKGSATLQNGALTLASAIGAYRTGENLVNLSTSVDSAPDTALHSIYLGWSEAWASAFAGRAQQSLTAGQGYLEATGTPATAGGSKFLVSGADDAGMARAVDLAATPDYMNQLSGASSVVTSDLSVKKELELNENGIYTFEDLGFDTVSLAGAFHQTASFTLPQPNNVQCGPNSTVTIAFSHSRALQADRSLLTVLIDGTEVDSVQLSDSNAVDGSLTVTIPETARTKANINVTVDVYNYIGKIDCSKDYYDVAWTVIDQSSSVFFDPSDERLRPRLSEFLQFNLWAETTESYVAMRTDAVDGVTLDLAARAGQENATSFDFSHGPLDQALSDTDKQNNLVFVGATGALSLPAELSAALAVAPRSDGTYQVAEQAPFIAETLANKVVFQVVRSPWNYDKYVYVITYPEGEESLLESIVQDGALLKTFAGTITCVDELGAVTTYDQYGNTTTGEAAPLTLEVLQYKVQSTLGISLWWLAGGIVLIILLIVLTVRLALKRKQFKAMEEEIKRANNEL